MKKSTFTDDYYNFVALLKKARKDKGLTQKQVADRLKKPQSYVSKYESRERRLDVIEMLYILKILGITPFTFFKQFDEIQKNSNCENGYDN